MYTYRIVSEATDAPEMTDLRASRIDRPTRPGGVFCINFEADYARNPVPFERAVGVQCKVIRTDENGETQECGGAVERVTPFVRVGLDGGGFS